MPFKIADVQALEILDSRARPTLSVTLSLADGTRARAGVPSGASTGSGEAVELRDGDPHRYGGAGVTRAVGNVNGEISEALRDRVFETLADLDQLLIELDGTANKARLGANAIVGVSVAAARAIALHRDIPLWQHLTPDGVTPRLPVPHFNVLNGGAHAANRLDFQEFMIAPLGAPTLTEAVRTGAEVYTALRRNLATAGHNTGLGDEGGFAPEIAEPEYALRLLVAAIRDAGYEPGTSGVAIALDPAATGFRQPDGTYLINGQTHTTDQLIERYAQIVAEFPVYSIEDGLGEDDHDGWITMTERLGERIQLVGDDNFVTNPAVIRTAIDDKIANAALIKVNQIGTVTETLQALAVCREAGYGAMISHRSGETDDTFIADLAVASGCGKIKTGAPARGERVAKYNRLLEIAHTHPDLGYGLAD
jgi:enolase